MTIQHDQCCSQWWTPRNSENISNQDALLVSFSGNSAIQPATYGDRVSLALIQHLKKWLTSPDMALRVRKLLKDCLEQLWGLLRFQT